MQTPKILGALNKSIIIAVVITALSFLLPIVPCKITPVVATPTYVWSMCKLPNPFTEQILGISTKYFGNSTQALTGLSIEFLAIFAIVLVIFMLLKRKSTKVLDLTHRKQ